MPPTSRCPAESEALITRSVETYGRFDCALNNAAIVCTVLPTADCPFEEWDAIITTNLRSGWLCMKFEIRQMLAPGSGASVNNLPRRSSASGTCRFTPPASTAPSLTEQRRKAVRDLHLAAQGKRDRRRAAYVDGLAVM